MLHLLKEDKVEESRKLLGEEAVEMLKKIFQDSVRVVEEVGFKCPVKEVQDIMQETGMAAYDESTGHIHILPEFIEEALIAVPKNDKFWIKGLSHGIGGTAAYLKEGLDGGLVEATPEDIKRLAEFVKKTDVVKFQGRGVKLNKRNLEAIKIMAETHNKTIYFLTESEEEIELAEKLHKTRGNMFVHWDVIQSPLDYYEHMSERFLITVRKGLPMALATMPLAGISAPYSMSGLVTLAFAEFLAGLAIVHAVNPGTRVICACYPTVTNIGKHYAMDFGSKYFNLSNILTSHIARMLDIPACQSGCTTNQKNVNEQALKDAKNGYALYKKYGGHLVRHSFGFTKDTLSFSPEKAKRTAEILKHTTAEDAPPLTMPRYDEEAFDAIARNSSKANYINDPHTLKNTGKEFID